MQDITLEYERYIFAVAMVVALLFVSGANAQVTNEKLRAELLTMVERDQKARSDCAKGDADEQMRCIVQAAETIDVPNTKRITEIANKSGFPTVKAVGADGVKAFMLILQHSDSIALRLKCKAGIERAFKDKVLSSNEYTNFVDRLLVKQGKPQIYGSNFESKGGRLVMSKTIDVKNLDKRRKDIGLPPIAEYVKMMKDAYNLEVVIPKTK
jgi:hypothetical protein